ncbi:hypothetical protein HFD88_003607 [Aspergillus terreus]|nr:hypothetical protein HFD88_003607 [Aspergillus terreus]
MDPMRASTGTVQLSSSYDPSASGRYSTYPSDRPYISSYDPRYLRDPRLEAQPISSTTYRDPGHGAKLRTEYAIRPRTRSSTMSVVSDNHLNGSQYNKPVSRPPPIITSGNHRPMSPLPGQDPYLVPAASPRHPRDPNYDYTSDTGRLDPRERARRAHMAYSAYRRYQPNHGPWRYPPAEGLRKGEDLDKYDVYSYTNPNELFENESVARLRYEQGRYRRERPLSLNGIDDSQLMLKKEPRSMGPPPSQRGFDKLSHAARPRRSTQGSTDSDYGAASGPRRSWHQAPVSLHQDPDEGYSSYREGYEGGRHRHRRHKRRDDDVSSRHSYDDRASLKLREPVASGALVAAAPAEEHDSDFHRRSRALEPRERERSGRARRRVSRRRKEDDSDGYTSDEDLKNYRREPSARRKLTESDASNSSSERSSPYLTVERPRRRRSHSRPRPRDLSPGKSTSPKDIPGRPDSVKKPDSASPDAPPKGILKPPRDKFPEEPNPIREGVAPLKDAHKKGIPPGARWTKIDRRLVNPAALEAGKERFEERPDCVIVLRVLTKEEIQAYALKTQEIRDSRYHEYVRERRRRREEDRRRGRPTADSSSDDEDENDDSLASEGSAESKLNLKGGQGAESGKAA